MIPAGRPLNRPHPRRRVIAALTIFGLLGYLLYVWLGDVAFPQVTLHPKVSSSEAAARARAFVISQGYAVAPDSFYAYEYRDELGYRYMEHTTGAAATRDLVESGQLPIMFWSTSGRTADQEGYFNLNVSFTGTVLGYSIYGPGASREPTLSQEDSQRVAEKYLLQMGWDVSSWALITPVLTTTLPPSTTQYNFVWQWPGEGWTKQLRLAADVIGHQATRYDYYLKVPEDFEYVNPYYGGVIADTFREMSKLVFLLAAGIVYYRALRHGGLPWRRDGLIFAGAFLLSLTMNVSDTIVTAWGWGGVSWDALLRQIFYYLNYSLRDAASIFLLWKGGTLLCRQVWPRQNRILPAQGNRWLAFRQAYWRGLMLAGLSLAYVAVFLVVARQVFNAGMLTEIQLQQQYAPALAPIFVSPVYEWSSSLWAGVNEELMFRFVGVTLMLYVFRSKALALIVPAALWGMCHLFYLRDPFYLRGIELFIAGVLLEGLFFLYFDLTTVIVGHFVYNVCAGQLLGVKSASPLVFGVTILMIVGLITPLALAWIMTRRTRRKQQARRPAGPAPHLALARSNDAAELAAFPVLPLDGEWVNVLGKSDCVVAALRSGDDLIGAAYGLIDRNGLGQLRYVYVQPEWRRQGWGTALADKISRHLQHRGAQQITVFPMKDSGTAQAFLFKLGYNARGQAYDLHPPQLFRWRRRSTTN